MTTERTTKYTMHTTRFQCGCIYQTSVDTLVFCPEHHSEWHRGVITDSSEIQLPGPDVLPEMEGLVMNPYMRNLPMVFMNSERNSIHTRTQTMDGRMNEWDDADTELAGLCAACFIEHNDHRETRIARCECGRSECSYRWCGETRGLHALWRIHANGNSEETMGIPEEDIFSHGPCGKFDQGLQEILERERNEIRGIVARMTRAALDARSGRTSNPHRTYHPAYLNPWLDRDCRIIAKTANPGERERGLRALTEKLTRLHVIGAMPPPQAGLQGGPGA